LFTAYVQYIYLFTLPQEDYQQFVMELLTPSSYARNKIKVRYTPMNGDWFIENKSSDYGNVKADSTFGTKRASAYRIIEDSLNLRDVRIFDYVTDEHGNRKAVFNHKETTAAQAKQEVIKQAFADWIWKDPERRNRLIRSYNDTFNSVRPREYDGSHITFGGISPEIKLRPHQVNAIAHILYGGNTLLAHKVGAGKTFEMVAAAQESKRLGLCQKSMFVVPNHLVGQWASEYLRLYPSANILVTTKQDFETGNRKRFCGRIATGDYDAVIIGHSQFEKIPMSIERQYEQLQRQLDDIERGIDDVQASHGEQFTVKQLMKTRKAIQAKLEKLGDTTRDQRMMFAVITMVITADSKEQLENDTEALLTTARKHLCQFATLRFQQVDGLNTVMPFGTRKIDAFRTLTTESLSVFIPFRVQDIFHENGIYYGQNVISKNMIIADRKQLLNGNSFILGVSGGGKSFAAKGEIINQVLSSDADIIIIDPEREYSQLVNAMGGEVINISATSDNHINAMDMNKDYGDGANPVILKSEFIMSLCEQLIGGTNLGAKQKSIIDRCTASVYRSYQQNDYQGHIPTLQDFRAELLQQDEPEAKELALAIELFTHGSLNTFAKQTNVDTNNRLICYDILDLGKQLMPIGMLVVLDSILNRITQNRAKGKNTFIFIDEIYLLFQHEYSANFLFTLWKRVRKYGAYASGITQNVDDLLQSHTARTMLANSEFIIMLNQASTDRLELAKLLNISDLQMSYITNVEAGHGLIKVGSSLVPFVNKFPRNTELYKLMTTKFGEV
jgi:hypothetical protein